MSFRINTLIGQEEEQSDILAAYYSRESADIVKRTAEGILEKKHDMYVSFGPYVVKHAMNAAEKRYRQPWRLHGPHYMRNRLAHPMFDRSNIDNGFESYEDAFEYVVAELRSKAANLLVSGYLEKEHQKKWVQSHADPAMSHALPGSVAGIQNHPSGLVRNATIRARPHYSASFSFS